MDLPGSDLTGRTIGEYQVTARLGIGGMGVVYEGRHPIIGKRVAVKVLMPHLSQNPELVERFVAEARAVNQIRHRGIVDIFAFGQLPEGAHYFIMEHLAGLPFDKLIRERSPLPVADVLWWVEQVCDALHAAHEAGIIHRDIKPSNMFLADDGRGFSWVKLLDFGIAKLGASRDRATPQTHEGVALGTPDYMSPEQANGDPIDPATDVYSVGCVLFELLTARRLFPADNPLQVMFKHVEKAPEVASTLREAVPPALDEVLARVLEKQPARRPTADALRRQLEAIRLSLPGEMPRAGASRPSSGQLPAVKPVAPPRRGLTLAAGAGAVGLVAAVGLFALWPRPPPAAPVPPPTPVVVVAPPPPAPPQVPKVEPPPPPPPPPTAPPKKERSALTAAALTARVSKLEKQLAAKEKRSGEPDVVLRQMLTMARSDAAAADTEANRRAVWKNLDELQAQLDAR